MDQTIHEAVIRDIKRERIKQHQRWGEQDITLHAWVSLITEELGESAKEANDFMMSLATQDGVTTNQQTRMLIRYRNEMRQTAALCVQALEALERNYDLRMYPIA